MKSKVQILATGATLFALMSPAVLAGSDAVDTAKLMQKIERLEQRIAVLESVRSFTQFMPDFSERFHVMHRAGFAGDWAVAAHELNEMKRLLALATTIDAKKGKLMQTMLGPNMEALDKVIEQGDLIGFEKQLVGTVNTCNACHAATNSPFIEVKLDATDSLGMRHPHKLMTRNAPEDHKHSLGEEHGTAGKMRKMMGKAIPETHDDEAPHGHDKHPDKKPHHD